MRKVDTEKALGNKADHLTTGDFETKTVKSHDTSFVEEIGVLEGWMFV